MATDTTSPLEALHGRIQSLGMQPDWHALLEARQYTSRRLDELKAALPSELPEEDLSVVVAGSLGRGEFTPGSDVDWYLLLDGAADPQHFKLAEDIGRALDRFALKRVGREGTFGGRVISHDLIHRIGGEEDSNSNLTRRMLLLLETEPIGPAVAFDRTFKNVLKRYLMEDRSFWQGTTRRKHHVPHFLLNDLIRFWRTMAVDFAYKLRSRGGAGAVIRNLKLRMSRKLIFVAGMLACFRCHLDYGGAAEREAAHSDLSRAKTLAHIERVFRLAPADAIASVLLRHDHLAATARRLFNSYSAFLSLLAGTETREHLEKATAESVANDPVLSRAFDASRDFGEAILEIFFDEPSGIGELTRCYGVF